MCIYFGHCTLKITATSQNKYTHTQRSRVNKIGMFNAMALLLKGFSARHQHFACLPDLYTAGSFQVPQLCSTCAQRFLEWPSVSVQLAHRYSTCTAPLCAKLLYSIVTQRKEKDHDPSLCLRTRFWQRRDRRRPVRFQ